MFLFIDRAQNLSDQLMFRSGPCKHTWFVILFVNTSYGWNAVKAIGREPPRCSWHLSARFFGRFSEAPLSASEARPAVPEQQPSMLNHSDNASIGMPAAWRLVPGAWCLVPGWGAWSLVPGWCAWCLVAWLPGAWLGCLVPRVWCLVLGCSGMDMNRVSFVSKGCTPRSLSETNG